MNYISTRGGTEPVKFCDAVMTGLARDGGLLLPEYIPSVAGRLDELSRLSYRDLAREIMRHYVDLSGEDLRHLIEESYKLFRAPEIAPVVRAGDMHILELFHGPTLAFKDIALQFLGNLFAHILGQKNGQLNIIAATSGDTGSAAIHGVLGRKGIRIFVMHPRGLISRIQEIQMTSVIDDNVFNLAIEGTFDDCQNTMKAIFNDLDFKDRYSLGSVNSVNWARILAQVVYYFYSAFRVVERTGAAEVDFTVPTGNFGDIFAGYIAVRMGLPAGRLVAATNENDILARFFNMGIYSKGKVVQTISPSMDIQVASNFERYLYYRAGCAADAVRRMMDEFSRTGVLSLTGEDRAGAVFSGGSAGTAETMAVIRRYWLDHGCLLDPHTAVGVHVAEKFRRQDVPMICLATAHAAKFAPAIKEAIGVDTAKHPVIQALEDLPVRFEVLPADTTKVRAYIAANAGKGK